MKSQRDKSERGITIAMLALFIVVLFIIAALAIDAGVLYTARTSAQHAADAAALAGAFSFTIPTATQPTAAQNAAIQIAAQNRIMGQAVTITAGAKGAPSSVYVDTANRRVTVTVSRLTSGNNGIATFFANVIPAWGGAASVQAIATAEASSAGAGSACLKPFFIPNSIFTASSNACGYSQTVFDHSTPANVTSFATGIIQQEQSWGIRPTTPGGALLPGQYYSLDFGSGASTFSCTIGQCLNQCGVSNIRCGNPYPVETGNMVGPTNQGIDTLVGRPPTDSFVHLGQYQTPNGLSDTSRALVIAPVWDNCAQTLTSGTQGQTVTVIGYLELFVDGMSGQTVTVHPIQAIPCSTASGSPGAGTGPLGIPVRLVQTP